MKSIYLDYNMFIFYLTQKEIKDKIENLKDSFVFPYSPAHMEEVATIYREDLDKEKEDECVNNIMTAISTISQNIEILPTPQGPNIYKIEEPVDCLNRVLREYHITLDAEFYDRQIACRKNKESLKQLGLNNIIDSFDKIRREYKINGKDIGNTTPENVFKDKKIIDFFKDHVPMFDLVELEGNTWEKIKNNGDVFAELIERLLKGLNTKLGYKSDSPADYRNTMHDITHTIYATHANFFVTDDKRTRGKAEAVYSLLKVPTVVLSKQEFLSLEKSND